MTLTHVIAFNLTLLAAMAAPGPALLYALRQSIAGGFRTGMVTGAGLGTVAALWTGAALLGPERGLRAGALGLSRAEDHRRALPDLRGLYALARCPPPGLRQRPSRARAPFSAACW
ncbi:LysE family transporter [Ponticoccus litoralis]|uniref:LysE family transporter n=1 Tax=Ponticoccus litoralis TaxID=422297 RepID=A0AAW9SD93_9RHOB